MLYANNDYDFNLDDYYDDADPAHIYTDAELQKTYIPTGIQYNETVSYVNNSESQTPHDTGVSMTKGSFDDTDNMHIDDNSYSVFTSDGGTITNYFYDSPAQWGEFAFTKGSGTDAKDILSNNGIFSTLTSTSTVSVSGDTYLGYIKPYNTDIITNWNEADGVPHWSKLDEYPDTNGDTLNIRETTETVHDRWNFGTLTLPANSYVSKIDIKMYTMKQTGSGMYIIIASNAFSSTSISMYEYYAWRTKTRTVNFNQAALNSLYLDVVPAYSGEYSHGWVDIETVYINIYYKQTTTTYSFDYSATWIFPEGTAQTLFYDYATSVAVDCDMDIWDWVAGSYNVELESESQTGYVTGSYDLVANPNKVSGTNQVRIRFQTAAYSSSFLMYIDQLTTYYKVETPDNSELDFTILSPDFSNYLRDDLIALKITSNHFTSLSTATTTKIWNDDTSTWFQLWSVARTSEFQETYTITSNIDQYFDGDGKVKLQYITYHATTIHTLSIDYIQILLVDKLDLVHTTSFDKVGEWKVRWEILGSVYYTSWVSYQVIGLANFEAISESNYPTRWILQNSTLTATEDFSDDIDPSDTWYLEDVSQDYFLEYLPDIGNYLLDNYSFHDSLYMSPTQFTDFDFTKGSGNSAGELETDNDVNYAIIDAGAIYGTPTWLGYMYPDGDLITNWNEADGVPHHDKLDDEDGGSAPDGGNIRETSNGIDDKWTFDDGLTIPAGHVVSNIRLHLYSQKEAGTSSVIKITTSLGLTTFKEPDEGGYSWEYGQHLDLDFNQAELDGFWMNVEPFYISDPGWLDIEAVYVEVWTYSKQYSFDYTITWDVTNPESIETFHYDYRTTVAVDCDLDIYDWDGDDWDEELQSNTGVGFITDSYVLTDRYISVDDQVRIRFQTPLTTIFTDFDMELDQIVFEYNSLYYISKKHDNAVPGYAYMQTNITESIDLLSQDYGAHYNLSSGDYFEVDFQTSSDSQINLILIKDGVINKTLVMSPSSNTNFNRHTIQISVSEDLEFDQLKVSSTFENIDYVKVWDIKTYNYTLAGDYADFYIGSKPSNKEIYLTPSDNFPYNLRVYEVIGGGEFIGINTNININTTGQTQYIYIPTPTQQCRLALFSQDNDYLPLTDYHIYVNRSLNSEYNQFALLDDVFIADDGTYVYIDIYDRFDTLIDSFTRLASNYIDLELEVYQLRIKSLLEKKTTVDINSTNTYELLSYDYIEFMLAESYYMIGYYDENDIYNQFTIYLNDNKAYELNSTHYNIYFSLYDQNGVRLDDSLFSLYINATRKDFGFVQLTSDDALILVQDYLNYTAFNSVITLRDLAEYNIVITVFEFQIRHLGDENSNLTLYETTTHNYIDFSMSPDSLNKYILSNSTYNCTWINGENIASTFYDITLDENYILTLNSSYFEVYFGLFTYDGLGLDRDTVRFYINNVRKDFGFNTLTQDTNTLLILDYFNQTLNSTIVNLRTFTEYNIYIDIYTLYIFNNYTHIIEVEIERNDIEIFCTIAPQTFFPYRFLPNIEYQIKTFHTNGTKLDELDLEFKENGQIVSFGFFSAEVLAPELSPDPAIITFILIIALGFVVIILLYNRTKQKITDIPIRLREEYIDKKKPKKDKITFNQSEF